MTNTPCFWSGYMIQDWSLTVRKFYHIKMLRLSSNMPPMFSKSSCPVYFLTATAFYFHWQWCEFSCYNSVSTQFYNVPIFVQFNKITIHHLRLLNIYHLIKDSNNLVMLASHVVHWSSPFPSPGAAIGSTSWVYPIKYAHSFVVLCFVVFFIINCWWSC